MTNELKTSASWRRCNTCKRDIGFDKAFYACSVSTCATGRHQPAFCSVNCWNEHVPVMRHRDAWAIQRRSPTRTQWEHQLAQEQEAERARQAAIASGAEPPPVRRVVVPRNETPEVTAPKKDEIPDDILVVATKLKAYIRARAGMNVSDNVMERLSDLIRILADQAIDHARAAGRKTVMDRDFTGPR